jgi:hypothetical protein
MDGPDHGKRPLNSLNSRHEGGRLFPKRQKVEKKERFISKLLPKNEARVWLRLYNRYVVDYFYASEYRVGQDNDFAVVALWREMVTDHPKEDELPDLAQMQAVSLLHYSRLMNTRSNKGYLTFGTR